MRKVSATTALALALIGCTATPPPREQRAREIPRTPEPAQELAKPQPPHYRCDGGLEFDVRFGDGSAELLFASREPETLLRDAGGTSPEHTVYSSTSAKAEFGLGADGREAKLNLMSPPLEARCVRS